MKKIPVYLAVLLFLGSPMNLMANEKHGAELIVQKKDGQSLKGELIAVKPSALLLLDSQSGVDVSLSTGDIKVIKIVKKSKALKGAGIGYLVSSVILCAVWWATDPEGFTDPEGGGPLVVAAVFGIPGLFVGGGIGAIMGIDEEIQLEGMDSKVLDKALEHLRKKARLSDFQ